MFRVMTNKQFHVAFFKRILPKRIVSIIWLYCYQTFERYSLRVNCIITGLESLEKGMLRICGKIVFEGYSMTKLSYVAFGRIPDYFQYYKARSHSWNSFNQGESFVESQRVTRCLCEKIAQRPQKWPKQSHNQLYSTKTLPKSLGNFFLEKNCPKLRTFAQMAKFFPIWSHWLSTKEFYETRLYITSLGWRTRPQKWQLTMKNFQFVFISLRMHTGDKKMIAITRWRFHFFLNC
jgi:hypothetical protein